MIQHADSSAVDSLAYGFTNVVNSNGGNIALSGILVVFLGLVLIAVVIHLFNKIFAPAVDADSTAPAENQKEAAGAETNQSIPEEHLIAISTAVELYRRLHLDVPESTITFERGEQHTGWKTGYKYGQRHALR